MAKLITALGRLMLNAGAGRLSHLYELRATRCASRLTTEAKALPSAVSSSSPAT